MFQFSETSAEGNYNLQYLSLNVRRKLRPEWIQPRLVGFGDIEKLHSLRSYSLFVPGAGFLYGDRYYVCIIMTFHPFLFFGCFWAA